MVEKTVGRDRRGAPISPEWRRACEALERVKRKAQCIHFLSAGMFRRQVGAPGGYALPQKITHALFKLRRAYFTTTRWEVRRVTWPRVGLDWLVEVTWTWNWLEPVLRVSVTSRVKGERQRVS